MKGTPKNGYTHHCSNKHCKQRLVRVLLDSGSDGDLIFASKDTPMLLPYSKRLVPQSWNTLNGIFQTKHKAWLELNFFDYLGSNKPIRAAPWRQCFICMYDMMYSMCCTINNFFIQYITFHFVCNLHCTHGYDVEGVNDNCSTVTLALQSPLLILVVIPPQVLIL